MTVDELIKNLGGTASVAKLTGVGKSAVSNWRRFGCLPPRTYFRIAAEGRKRGVDVPEHLFREQTRTAA